MNFLKIISPTNNHYPSLENFDSKIEFSKLTKLHKAITLVATGAISIATLGLATSSYFHKLVGRFRKYELDEKAHSDASANKATRIAAIVSLPASTGTQEPANLKGEPPAQTKLVPVPDAQKPARPPRSEVQPLAPLQKPRPAARPPVPQKPLPQPPEKKPVQRPARKPVEDFTQVSKEFWDEHVGNGKLHRFLEMAAISGDDNHQAAAEFVVDHYIGYKQEQGPFALSGAQRSALINSVREQLAGNAHPKHEPSIPKIARNGQFEAEISNVIDLADGRQLIVYYTGADGSCAIHALLGNPDAYGQYVTDASQYRQELCNWLEEKQRNKMLPNVVFFILKDYFENFDLSASDSFKTAVRSQYNKYKEAFERVAPKNAPGVAGPPMSEEQIRRREAILNDFINDPVVFKAYLAELRNTRRYLLIEELELAAQFFKKHVILYQPYPNSTDIPIQEFNASASGEPVHIWYNGGNHYERAAIIV